MDVLRARDLVDVPWKNGGGTTRDIAAGKTGNQTAWRISRADVDQDGAFSDFAGLTRVLTVVSGGGMVLKHAEGAFETALWEPVVFDGALKISSQLLDGPLTDLNLMFDPMQCRAEVTVHRGPNIEPLASQNAAITALHVLAGTPKIGATQLAVADTAFINGADGSLDLSVGDAVLVIRLTYTDQSSDIRLCIAAR